MSLLFCYCRTITGTHLGLANGWEGQFHQAHPFTSWAGDLPESLAGVSVRTGPYGMYVPYVEGSLSVLSIIGSNFLPSYLISFRKSHYNCTTIAVALPNSVVP